MVYEFAPEMREIALHEINPEYRLAVTRALSL